MPDREKVIKHIADYINAVDGLANVQWVLAELDVLKDALALLKAQEPLEPVIVNGEPECAECLYELRSDADSYCPCCGRKVKWE